MGVDVDAYLARIGAARDDPPAVLHTAHVRSVPFEDYDIHRGVAISLDLDDLFDKIVRRGALLAERFGITVDGWVAAVG